MSVLLGARLGPYEILSTIGAGGMGEVYRARDTRLDRTVAIKVLRGTALDLHTRFGREAKAIAALAHPHICTLFDIGHEAGTDYLVMEYLEGETLADALRRGALPFEEALKTAVEIGEALDHAHHAGIVHRDLKPSNVMLTNSGAKLLDFGLAKFHTQRSGACTTQAITESLSAESGITGTVPYMAPEQLEGHEGDARSDLFAFGALLYEMVTGRRAFAGESQAHVMAAILEHHPPPMSTLQPLVPPALDRVVKKCLAKDRDDRWQTARDLADELKWIEDGTRTVKETDVFDGMRTRPWIRTRVLVMLAVALVSLALGTFFGSRLVGNLRETSARFWVAPPPGSTFARGGATTFIALSPDGSQLAFVARESASVPASRIWIRPLSGLEARPVPGTEGAVSVFWSADGRSLGFFTFDKLKRVDLSENAVSTMCDAVDGLRSTGTWGSDGRILFASVLGESILSVAAAGGGPSPEVHRDEARGETFLQWPSFLPDGRRFVYVARLSDGSRQLMLKDAAGAPHPILSVASKAEWVEPGYFVFARRDGALMAQRFDLSRERIVGEPSLIAQSVDYAFTPGRAMFTASWNGNLAYQPQQFQRMIWLDRAGKELASVGPPAEDYGRLKLSPNGGDLLFSRIQPGTGSHDLWALDLRRGVESRLTSDPGSEIGSVWLPGGHAVVFSADRGTPPPHVFSKNLATGVEDEWLPAGKYQLVEDVSPDGSTLVFSELASRGHWEIFLLAINGSHDRAPLITSPSAGIDARFSPDGRFISFTSSDAGSGEVYVIPFPRGAKVRVSANGGSTARWSRDSRELFYLSADHHLMAVPVRTQPSLHLGTPVSLFMAGEIAKRVTQEEFDVSHDGSRFIAVVPGPEARVAVVEHWTSEVGR